MLPIINNLMVYMYAIIHAIIVPSDCLPIAIRVPLPTLAYPIPANVLSILRFA